VLLEIIIIIQNLKSNIIPRCGDDAEQLMLIMMVIFSQHLTTTFRTVDVFANSRSLRKTCETFAFHCAHYVPRFSVLGAKPSAPFS